MKKLTILITMLMTTSAGAAEDQVYDNQSNGDNSLYLACELNKSGSKYKPGPHTIKDLLENKIDLKLNKKKLKKLKKGFNSDTKGIDQIERMLNRDSIYVPREYIDKQFLFVAFRILDKADKDNKKIICKESTVGSSSLSSYMSNMSKPRVGDDYYSSCKAFEQNIDSYKWEKKEKRFGRLTTWEEFIHRETLIYLDRLHAPFIVGGGVFEHAYYQCHVSNLEEINKLFANSKNYLKPFEEEWERLISELRLKDEARRAKNKI